MWEKINDHKSQIGIIMGNVLFMVVAMSDSINWTDGWVVIAMGLIGTWTGFAFRHAIKKAQA